MGLDDLLGNAEAEPGMGAVFLSRRPFAVEAVEDGGKLAQRDARPLVAHAHPDLVAVARRGEADDASRQAQRHGIADEVAEPLDNTDFQPVDLQPLLARDVELSRRPVARHGEVKYAP